MKELYYRCQFDKDSLIIVPLQGSDSIYADLDKVLAEIEVEIGSFVGRYILCEGTDGFWDLITPRGKGELSQANIYPLNALTLLEAKKHLRELIISGRHIRIFS